jgi:N-acetylmuramoyl-L-alanine amidase
VVQDGDTLTSIAARYGLSVQDLQDANGLTGETIQVGQRITIPARQ